MDGCQGVNDMNCELSREQVVSCIEQYGSPLYIFHAEEFKKNYLELLNSMRKIYSKYNIAYSYKTNYTPKIIAMVRRACRGCFGYGI